MRPAPIDRRKIKILRTALRRKFYAATHVTIHCRKILLDLHAAPCPEI